MCKTIIFIDETENYLYKSNKIVFDWKNKDELIFLQNYHAKKFGGSFIWFENILYKRVCGLVIIY